MSRAGQQRAAADEVLLSWMRSAPALWQLPAGLDPQRLAMLISVHRVAAWLDARGRARLEALDPRLARAIRDAALAAAAQERFDRDVRREVLGALAARKLCFVPLKGSVLAPWLYATPAQRPAHDLDVLVAEKDFGQAVAVLGELGYRRADREGTPWSDAWSHEQAFWRGADLPVELHRHVTQPGRFSLPLAKLFARAEDWTWEGLRLRRLALDDQFLSLVIHAAHHQFLIPLMQWMDLRLLMDRGVDLARVARRAGEAGALTALRMAGAYLRTYFADRRLEEVVGRSGWARRMALRGVVSTRLPTGASRGFSRDRWTAFWLLDHPAERLGFSAGYALRWVLDRPFALQHQRSRQRRARLRPSMRRSRPASVSLPSGCSTFSQVSR